MDEQFNAPSAEFALESSDGVCFAVHKLMLELASHVFRDMLSFPQPATAGSPSRPVISMSEDAQSLRILLRFCYPRTFCPEPALVGLDDIKRAATLAQKYAIELMRDAAERALISFAEDPRVQQPDVAYAVAWRYEYPDALRAAARRSLEPFSVSLHAPEFEDVPATSSIALRHYQRQAGRVLQSLLDAPADKAYPVTWIQHNLFAVMDSANVRDNVRCSCEQKKIWFLSFGLVQVMQRIRSWWWFFVHSVVSSLKHNPTRYSLDDAFSLQFEALFSPRPPTNICPQCTKDVRNMERVLEETKRCLRVEIERRFAQIPLEAPFMKAIGKT
ncbi:unnamed protein product [Peniophora sp. CBMAI 1063]|nr:unnamed protein product [Peniophora sp. CBMAI 1063]